MKKTVFALLATFAVMAHADVLPESMRVYPTPQEVTLTDVTIKAPASVALNPANGFDADALRVLSAAFKVEPTAEFKISWSLDKTLPAEGYTLVLTKQGAVVSAADASGIFYAMQTFRQLFASGTAQGVAIRDWPAIPFRGTVEGFYGQPWSFEARKSQFRFYGDWKMNTYIYGPKDDPYHGFSTKWRDPYPETEAKRIAELVKVAKENKVNFVWAVHPGRDIQWQDNSDIMACVAKFEMMYKLGVRSFAVFFDDIGGEGARAEKQVELLNTVNRLFVRTKPDVTPLILCPTQYNKAWSGGPYLKTLGTGLDADIMVMWTGNSVCTDITKESMEWINNELGRKAYIWWNWPVADYCRTAHLLLGRTYGLDPENAPLYSGFVSNPMDKPEASKIGLFGVADYVWNPTAFKSGQAWRDGIRRLFPYCHKAVQVFAEHNSDQGPNGHGYRREESVTIRPAVERLTAALKAGKELPADDVKAVQAEFKAMADAGETILKTCKNKLFMDDVTNWCEVFVNVGRSGEALMKALAGECSEAEAIQVLIAARASSAAVSAAHAAKPFQKKPTEVATLVMMPWHNLAAETVYNRLWQTVAGKPAPKVETKAYEFITNMDSLKNLAVKRDGIYVRLPKVHEPKTVNPGDWFGIRLPDGVPCVWVHFKLHTTEVLQRGRLQLSKDGGNTWGERATVRHGKGEMEIRHIRAEDGINAARFINLSDKPITVTLEQVKVDVPSTATENVFAAMTDGNLSSGYTLAAGAKVRVPLAAPVAQDNVFIFATGSSTVAYEADAVVITAGAQGVTVYEIVH